MNILPGESDPVIDKTSGVVDEFVHPGCLEPILTQVCSLASPLQIPLHELDPQNQTVGDSGEVPMSLDIGGDTPGGNLVDLLL